MPNRIEDYALIGDCEAAALVSRNGSIDWLCWPRFDSDACFAALLGNDEHGRWLIAPRDSQARVTRQYRRNTLVLETRFECGEGAVKLIDFMPMRGAHSHLAPPEPLDSERALVKTESHWTEWANRCTPAGRYSDTVTRSLITLKALTYWPTCGIVAAPTTSLPEHLGGVRNWDYRFCW